MEIAERFINYTKFDTQSADESETVPSTAKQLIFAKYLKEELEREGLKEVEMDEKVISTQLFQLQQQKSSYYWFYRTLRYSTRCKWC